MCRNVLGQDTEPQVVFGGRLVRLFGSEAAVNGTVKGFRPLRKCTHVYAILSLVRIAQSDGWSLCFFMFLDEADLV